MQKKQLQFKKKQLQIKIKNKFFTNNFKIIKHYTLAILLFFLSPNIPKTINMENSKKKTCQKKKY